MADESVTPTESIETPSFSFEGKSESAVPEQEVIEQTTPEVVEKEVVNETPKVEAAIVEKETPIAETKKTFANEDSENIYNLLVEGKDEEVLSVLNEQKKLKEADKLSPSEILKLNMQYQNKDFTSLEINDLFNETYELPEVPEQELTETDEEFEDRTKQYDKQVKKIESRMARDSKPAIIELQKQLKDIVLPSLKVEPKAIEVSQEDLAELQKANEKFLKQVNEDVQAFDGYTTTFKDEEVEMSVGYKLTKEDREQIQPLVALSASDAGSFLQKIGWLDENGNIDTKKMSSDLPLILNKEKVFQKIASETGNKRHAESIKSIKNIDYSGKQNNQVSLGKSPEALQEEFANHFFSNS